MTALQGKDYGKTKMKCAPPRNAAARAPCRARAASVR
jgi:hypothetical protein